MVKLPIDNYWSRLHEGYETQTDYAKENYSRLRQDVLEDALLHKGCPLTRDDKQVVRVYLKKAKKESIILSQLRKIIRLIKIS